MVFPEPASPVITTTSFSRVELMISAATSWTGRDLRESANSDESRAGGHCGTPLLSLPVDVLPTSFDTPTVN